MVKGIYNSSASMQYLDNKLDVVANNLANTTTHGFKKSNMAFRQNLTAEHAKCLDEVKNCTLPKGEIITYIETTQGSLQQTDSKLNFALDGEGFFTIQTPDGFAWTRDGAFTFDEEGYLTTMEGYAVLGEYNGPIRLFGKEFSVSDFGDIVVDNQVVNKFLIQNYDISEVIQKGNNLYYPRVFHEQYFEEPTAKVKQGYLEGSNVNIVKEMISMISINRQYQMNDKAIKANDDALNKAVNNIARS
jgi:flagellar basal-body rod protein FlgG